jgi:hypothetical protein
MSVEPFKTKSNDTGKPYKFKLTDSGGGVDLTGTTIRTTMTNIETGAKKINRSTAGITLDADQVTNPGIGERAWQTGERDTPGEYEIEFEVTFAGGEKNTWPDEDAEKCIVIIEQDLDET